MFSKNLVTTQLPFFGYNEKRGRGFLQLCMHHIHNSLETTQFNVGPISLIQKHLEQTDKRETTGLIYKSVIYKKNLKLIS